MLIGHIVPDMKLASLLGMCVLSKAGCKVIFDDKKCQAKFRGKTILTGYKDPTSDLWTLYNFNEERLWTPPGIRFSEPPQCHTMGWPPGV
jgi:hypothetical protein